MQKTLVFGVIKALHDLFTALWIGGLLTTAFSFMPVFKKSKGQSPESKQLLVGYQRRLRVVFLISVIGLWITGLLLGRGSAAYDGFLSFSTTYNSIVSIKHLLIFVMMAVGVYRGFVLGSKIEEFQPKQQKIYTGLLMLNSFLGIVVLVLSGICAALG
jgi:putative copper export protein